MDKTNIAAQKVANFLKQKGIKVEKVTQATQEESAYIDLENGRQVQVTLYQPFVVRDGLNFVAIPENTRQLLKAVQ